MMLLLRFLTLLLPLVAASPALAASVPLDAEPFTQYVARAFEKALPDADVTVSGPLHLSITAANGSASASFLGELHDYCKRNPDDCRKAIGEYVADMSPTYRDEPEPEKGPTTVTFVVRPQRYVDELNRETAKQGGPIAEQLVGDLWIIAANDQPKTIEMMTAEQAKQLDLTPKKILALAKRNLRKPIMAFLKRYAKKAKPHAIDMLAGGPYQASLLAYPKNWKTIVKAKGGSLMCALPANNLIICADGDDAQTAKIVHDEALIAMKKAERPLSSQVISWQDGEWVVVKTAKKD